MNENDQTNYAGITLGGLFLVGIAAFGVYAMVLGKKETAKKKKS